jgi:Cu+-exporting ATPase
MIITKVLSQRDPVCGMALNEKSSLRTELDGKTFYFCSVACQKTFLSAPSVVNAKENSGVCCS